MVTRVYVANLPSRNKRKEHTLSEFHGRDEFSCVIVPATTHRVGAVGLWLTIRSILEEHIDSPLDYIVFCEDDHQFTTHYSKEKLHTCIQEAALLNADVLLGGVSWFQSGIQVTPNLFWVERFTGLQFTVIFRKFFRKMLEAEFTETDCADYKISDLSLRKFVAFPFLSTQKEFGYSDVTHKNDKTGRVEQLFDEASERLGLLKSVREHYKLKNKLNVH